MKTRIAGWACAGFIVAGCWALYFARASKGSRIEPIVYILAGLTQPLVFAIHRFGVSFYFALLVNIATYALIGLIVETVRRQLKHAK